MQRYIEQLIEDFHEITAGMELEEKIADKPISDDESFWAHIEDVENYLHGELVPVSVITGIATEMLPPSEKLSKQQKELLSIELEKFLQYFHFELDFPQNYPSHLRYSFIRDFWNQEHTKMRTGTSHIEFCSYEKENCPFPDHCKSCDEFEDDMEDSENFLNNKNNFFDDEDIPF